MMDIKVLTALKDENYQTIPDLFLNEDGITPTEETMLILVHPNARSNFKPAYSQIKRRKNTLDILYPNVPKFSVCLD